MSGIDRSGWGLTTDDDDLHPRTDDPWWTETVWFAWMVPERKMLGYFYPVLRPNLGVQAGGLLLFDDTAELPWELPVFDYAWHNRLPDDLDLRHARFGDLSVDVPEPGHYELGYEGREMTMRLHAETIAVPLLTSGTPPFVRGHIDQLCHVTGTMTLDGEDIVVDCIAVATARGGRVVDGKQPTVGYDYSATDAGSAFLAVSVSRVARTS